MKKKQIAIVCAWVGACCATAFIFQAIVAPRYAQETQLLTAAHDAYVRANENDERLRNSVRFASERRRLEAATASLR
ncbi:MAG TPA: hypothetical protein VGF18_09915, partial [Candidatus Tumulicola sp.]